MVMLIISVNGLSAHFSFSDVFHQLSAKTEELVFCVVKADMGRFVSQYELGQK